MNRAVFLDRDGTLNVERHYLHDPDQLEIIPGSGLALRRLMDAGYRLFIVTNQSGIGRGYYTEADMHAVNNKLSSELAASDGVAFEKIYFAPESHVLHFQWFSHNYDKLKFTSATLSQGDALKDV